MEVSKDICTDTTNLRHRAVRLVKNKPLVTAQCSDCNMQKNLYEARANLLGQEASKGEGTGISLAMSKRLVELMGADELQSAGDRGEHIAFTTKIYMPLNHFQFYLTNPS